MAEYNHERFYWLKLKKDFFKRHDIRIIESMPNGEKYVLFYLKLMAESIDHDGYLRFSETIPYDEKMLSVITNTDIDTVRSATKLLHELGMVEIMSDKTMYLTEVKALIGSQTISAEKKQLQLQKRAEATLSGKGVENFPPEKELDIEIDKREIYKEKSGQKSTATHTRFIKPTLDEVKAYCEELKNNIDAQRFIDYYASKGWVVGKNSPMKDWKACVRTWEQLKDHPTRDYDERTYTTQEIREHITNIDDLDIGEL